MAKGKGISRDEIIAVGNTNPAAAIIAFAEETEESVQLVQTAHTEETKPTKSRRLNVRLFPSVYEDFKTVASMKRTNVNDLLNEVMAAYNEANKGLIAKYHEHIKED